MISYVLKSAAPALVTGASLSSRSQRHRNKRVTRIADDKRLSTGSNVEAT